jgi:aspartyl protease family protein
MLRFALTIFIAVVAAAFFASSLLKDKLSAPAPQQTVAVAQQEQPAASAQAAQPVHQASQSLDTVEIAPDSAGNYLTDIDIDGRTIHVVVDTGATYLSLTSEDADALGLNLAPADFRYQTMTANGIGTAAKVRLNAIRIANIEIDDVDALVMQPGALGRSLLGMSALSRLGGVRISDGRLVLQR